MVSVPALGRYFLTSTFFCLVLVPLGLVVLGRRVVLLRVDLALLVLRRLVDSDRVVVRERLLGVSLGVLLLVRDRVLEERELDARLARDGRELEDREGRTVGSRDLSRDLTAAEISVRDGCE